MCLHLRTSKITSIFDFFFTFSRTADQIETGVRGNICMKKIGLRNPRLVDQCKTTTEEQRSTDWMTFDSLETFLDQEDPNKTIEGYPAPIRAVFVAEAPAS